ncbi:MAG TPA: glycosyltransferase family 4 protein [Salinivirgaceae bacterium]|nr:glycosyltransferase family 4 protein [Salinivirgaceae bacterium]
MKQIKICLVVPTLHPGGMERVMSEYANYLSQNNEYDVHLILYGRANEIFYPIPSNVTLHKPNFKFNNKFRTWYTLKTLFFIRRKISKISPVAILSFGELWNNFILLATIGINIPVVVSDRCSPLKRLKPIDELLRKVLYKRAKFVIVQTNKAKEIYTRFLPKEKLLVIPNPIKKIQPNSNKPIEKENIILSIGRLIETKHHDRLIKIFSNLDAPQWKLVIIGGDAQKQKNMEKLQQQIEELNLKDRVELLGYVKNIEEWYFKASIFAFTSSSEGFPNVVGEALSAGIPVVSYDCIAGPSEMIIHGVNGFLVPVFDDLSFAKYLQILIDNPNIRQEMGLEASKICSRFDINEIGVKFTNSLLYENPSNQYNS